MIIIQIGSYPLNEEKIEGGVEASVIGLAKELSNNHNLIVFDLPRHEINSDTVENKNGLKIYRFASNSSNNFFALKRVKEIVNRILNISPDICHIHGTGYIQTMVYLQLRKFNLPIVLTVHGLLHIEKWNEFKSTRKFISFNKFILLSFCEFCFLSLIPQIIVDTKYVEDEILKYKKQRKIFRLPQISIIPQGINDIYFNLKTSNTIDKNEIISVGAIYSRKGQIELLDAMSLVIKKIPHLKLNIVGFVSDKAYFERLKSKITALNLEKNISVFTNVSNNDLINYYKNCSVFVLNSNEESQGIVLCEAMASGKPIVTTNVGGIPNVIEDNINGLLSEYGDINKLAENISKVLTDNELFDRISYNNKLKSLNYNWKLIGDKVVTIYQDILSN